jgi:alpha-tubulin suppressor-like RCC1 family protein
MLAVVVAAFSLSGVSTGAHAQVGCALNSYAFDLFLPGGGAITGTGFIPTQLVAPGSRLSMGVYCEGTGQFPPPVIAGATYAWNTGQTTQRIEATAPAAGQTATYRVTVTGPNGTKDLSVDVLGANPGVPICTVKTTAPQALTPGTVFTVTAVCAPAATSFAWDAREFLGYNTILTGTNTSSATIRYNGAQPGQVMPIYLTVSNGAGRGPFASLLVIAGNPSAGALNPARVAAGGSHTCGLTTAGGVKCWGEDTGGQLGDFQGASFYSTVPVNVIGAALDSVSLTSGLAHACVLVTGGTARCWGDNAYGQLGDGTGATSYLPANVYGLAGAASIVAGAGSDHTCAVTLGHNLKCWGRNTDGQLGNGATFNVAFPIDVTVLGNTVASVAVGRSHTCVVTTSGGAKCWGRNSEGQLGDGTTVNRTTAVDVSGLSSNVVAISAGDLHSCALMTDRSVKCWGSNGQGELGTNNAATFASVPATVAGLSNVASLSIGGGHSCASTTAGALKCWGRNSEGQLGDRTTLIRTAPADVPGMASGVVAVSAGRFHTCAIITGGGVLCWGLNGSGRVGDGTLAQRNTPQLVLGERAIGYLDLTLEDGFQPPADKIPVFPAVAAGTLNTVVANIQFRAGDAGTVGNVYTFALAPSSIVKNAPVEKDAPVQCVLAQLNAAGELHAVTASTLQAYVSGVLSAQGQAVTILNGQAIAQIGGAVFYVGYGTSANVMFTNGTNRSVVGRSDPGTFTCQPQAPQTGWWWNPAEGGRGYSIEVQGNHIFFAAFLYDPSGRATWHVASGSTSLDGSLFQGDLLGASGGQTLGGAYSGFPRVLGVGPITLSFNDATHGTMIWPGGAVPIERFVFAPNGLTAPAQPNQPESGWWWNPQEDGRGFFIEWQNGSADIAGYMYDDAGQPIWYIAVYPTSDAQVFNGNWWQYANGQTLMGPLRPAIQVSDHVAPVTVRFQGPDTAVMTLPNGRSTALRRQRF